MNDAVKAATCLSSTTAALAGRDLRYLEEWTRIAKAFDIATGFFEICARLRPTGRTINKTARSFIKGLVREKRIERNGSWIRVAE